jgi:hypothetical protein
MPWRAKHGAGKLAIRTANGTVHVYLQDVEAAPAPAPISPKPASPKPASPKAAAETAKAAAETAKAAAETAKAREERLTNRENAKPKEDAREAAEARALNRLPFLGPIFALGWPLDDPGGPRNQLKKSQKAGGSA